MRGRDKGGSRSDEVYDEFRSIMRIYGVVNVDWLEYITTGDVNG